MFQDFYKLTISIVSLQLHYLRLPSEIHKDYVILMDATVATGAAAMMAIRVLLVSQSMVIMKMYSLAVIGSK